MEHRRNVLLLLDVLEEGRRVGAVAPVAVGRGTAGLRGIGDDGAVGTFDLGKSALDRGASRRADRALQLVGQRIVAAGVEHQDAQVLGLLQILEDVVDAGGAAQIGLVGKLGIDRNQIVDPRILQRVTAVIEHRHVGIARCAGEPDGGVLHFVLVEIEADDGLEAGALQRRADIFGVMRRIGQMRCVQIGAVADHERDPPVRGRRLAHQAGQQQNDQSSRNPQSSLPR